MKLPWLTIAKYAGTAILAVAGTMGTQELTKSTSTARVAPVAATCQPCPACNPTLKCPALPTPECKVSVTGVPLVK